MDKLTSLSFEEVMKQLVDDNLMSTVGDTLNEAKVKTGTVHFTLTALIAADLCEEDRTLEESLVSMLSLNNFMYQYICQTYSIRQKKGRH